MMQIIRREADAIRIDPALWLLWLPSAIMYACGWLMGFIWRGIVWLAAAFVAGFKAGRG
jgi:hypothetical protein